MSFKEEIDDAMKYKVECALKTLIEAEEIRKDDALMSEVVKMAKEQKDAITSIAGLKAKYKDIVDGELKSDNAPKVRKNTSSETTDPLAEENTYIARVDRAQKEANAPDAEVVTVMEQE